jgi:hypothetical protein
MVDRKSYNQYYTEGIIRNFSLSYNAVTADIGKKLTLELRRLETFDFFPPPSNYVWAAIFKDSSVTITQSNVTNLNLFNRKVFPAKHMKEMSVEEFLLAVKQLGVDISFNHNSGTVSLDFITDKTNSTNVIDWTDKAVDDYELDLDNYNKGYSLSYNFSEYDNLITDNFKIINPADKIGDIATVSDLPAIMDVGKIAFIKNLNQFYINAFDAAASPQYFWKKYSDNYYTIKYADGVQEVKLGFSPMLMAMAKNKAPIANATLETALMPAIKSLGNSEMFGAGSNDFDLKFCFLRGQNIVLGAPNNKGGNYMYAGTTTLGLNGNIVGQFDFTLHENSGFFKRFLDAVYELTANGQVIDKDFRLNEVDILNLSNSFKISIDGVIFLLKTISLMAGKKITLSRVKMIKFQ